MTSSFQNCMRRMADALLPCIALLASSGASGQSAAPSQPTAQAASVIVTSSRTPQRVDRALAQVSVIDRARIDAATGLTLAQLLASESGVQVWSNGGLGKTATVSLRGLEGRHTLLLIDGVRYGSATVGSPSWDNIPLQAIERIEIARGPMSGLYGSDAVGGVIQLFTRSAQAGFHADANATVASQGYRELDVGVGFGAGVLDGSLRVQHRRTQGFSDTNPHVPFGSHNPDRDGFDQTSVSGRLAWRLGSWRAEATLLKAEGTAHYDDGPGTDAHADLNTELLSAQLSGALTPGWRTVLKLGRAVDGYDTRASASAFTPLGNIGTRQHQLSWQNLIDTPVGSVLVLAERLTQAVERPGTPFAVSERTIHGFALGLNGEAGAHGWQASLRRDRNSQFGGQTSGSLAYGLELAAGLRATASFGSSFVAPSFNQLYFPGFGNPRLLPEQGRQRELGLVWRHGPVVSRLVAFDNRIRGYISSGPLPANIPRAKVEGISASVDARLGAWTLAGSIDNIQPVNDTAGSANFGKQLPRRVQDSARMAVSWQGGPVTLGSELQAFGARFDDAANTARLAGYARLDLRAEWVLARDWALAARLNNALDKRFETLLGYNQPGREAALTLRWAQR